MGNFHSDIVIEHILIKKRVPSQVDFSNPEFGGGSWQVLGNVDMIGSRKHSAKFSLQFSPAQQHSSGISLPSLVLPQELATSFGKHDCMNFPSPNLPIAHSLANKSVSVIVSNVETSKTYIP